MTVLLHFSDTHFGTEEAPVVQALQALVREQQPDALILSGDITQRARSAQFAAARSFCDSLGVARLLALPGNHDIPLYNLAARMFAPYAGYKACFGDELEPELEFGDVLVIGVNTTRPARHKDGVVSAAQINRVANAVVKPASEGSSIGMSKVRTAAALDEAYALAVNYDRVVIAEQFIDGIELTCGILGSGALPLIRLETPRDFYD